MHIICLELDVFTLPLGLLVYVSNWVYGPGLSCRRPGSIQESSGHILTSHLLRFQRFVNLSWRDRKRSDIFGWDPVTVQGEQSGRSEPIGCLFCPKRLGSHRSLCPFLHYVFSNTVWQFLRGREKTCTDVCKLLNEMKWTVNPRAEGLSLFPAWGWMEPRTSLRT